MRQSISKLRLKPGLRKVSNREVEIHLKIVLQCSLMKTPNQPITEHQLRTCCISKSSNSTSNWTREKFPNSGNLWPVYYYNSI